MSSFRRPVTAKIASEKCQCNDDIHTSSLANYFKIGPSALIFPSLLLTLFSVKMDFKKGLAIVTTVEFFISYPIFFLLWPVFFKMGLSKTVEPFLIRIQESLCFTLLIFVFYSFSSDNFVH